MRPRQNDLKTLRHWRALTFLVMLTGYIGGAPAAGGTGVLADTRGRSQIFLFPACCVLLLVASTCFINRHFRRLARPDGPKAGTGAAGAAVRMQER